HGWVHGHQKPTAWPFGPCGRTNFARPEDAHRATEPVLVRGCATLRVRPIARLTQCVHRAARSYRIEPGTIRGDWVCRAGRHTRGTPRRLRRPAVRARAECPTRCSGELSHRQFSSI